MTVKPLTRFTSTAAQALSFAQQQAAVENAPTIELRHLLIGLAQLPNNQSTAAHVLNGLGITAEKLQALPFTRGDSRQRDLSEEVRRTLEHAAHVALQRGDHNLASAHLLAGALQEKNIVPILEQLGMAKQRISGALSSLEIWAQEP